MYFEVSTLPKDLRSYLSAAVRYVWAGPNFIYLDSIWARWKCAQCIDLFLGFLELLINSPKNENSESYPGRRPSLDLSLSYKSAIFGRAWVPIGTQKSVLSYINHSKGPHTFCADRTCKGRCVSDHSKCRSYSQNVFQQLHKFQWALCISWKTLWGPVTKFCSVIYTTSLLCSRPNIQYSQQPPAPIPNRCRHLSLLLNLIDVFRIS